MKRMITLAVACASVVAVVAVVVSGASGAPATAAASKAPYVIGSISTQTGTFASSDAAGALGMKAWAKYVNSHGGINGHQVQLSLKDDQNNPSVALAEVKQFIANKKVIALVGNVTAVENAFGPVAAKAGLPIVGDFPFTPFSYSTKGVYPQSTTFPSILYGEVYSAVKLAKAGKVSFLYCAEEPACALSTPVVKQEAAALGGSMVNAQGVPATAPNYDAVCTAAKKAGATSIVMALGAGTIISLAQSCSSVGYNPKYVLQTTALTPAMGKVPALKNSAYGVVGTFPWTSNATPAQKAFQAGIKAAKVPASQLGAALSLGWTGGALFQAAASKVKGGNVTRASIQNALASMKGNNLGGLAPPLTFKANAPSPQVKCFFVMKLTGGKWAGVGGPSKTYCQK